MVRVLEGGQDEVVVADGPVTRDMLAGYEVVVHTNRADDEVHGRPTSVGAGRVDPRPWVKRLTTSSSLSRSNLEDS